MKNIKEWANRNKLKLLSALLIMSVVLYNYRHFLQVDPPKPPVQKEEVKLEIKKEESKKVDKQEAVRAKESKSTKVTTRTFDKKTGKVVKEVVKESVSDKEIAKDTEVKKVEQVKLDQKEDVKISYKKPYTGITAGIIAVPSGTGAIIGATLAELQPLTANAQIGVLIEPQHSIVAGLSVNGEVATNLEIGVGVYLGPQTHLGYTPVPGLPVSVQPGINLQYRF